MLMASIQCCSACLSISERLIKGALLTLMSKLEYSLLAIHRTIGFRNWKDQPFAKSYLGIEGAKGRFLGFYAVIMQAAFSFFGSEVPGIVCLLFAIALCFSDAPWTGSRGGY